MEDIRNDACPTDIKTNTLNKLCSIGNSIEEHCRKEREIKEVSICAIARVESEFKSTYKNNYTDGKVVFWLTNQQSLKRSSVYTEDGFPVYKNTKVGELLIKYYQGTHHYRTITNTKKTNNCEITIYNKATFSSRKGYIADVVIRLAGDENIYRFQNLSDLIKSQYARKIELERKQKEIAALKEREKEAKRLEEQQKEEERQRQIEKEIKILEEEIARSDDKIKQAKSFIRYSVSLRSQPILDEYQEKAKRSHIYDGIPIIIEGGPGTGKTTTVIQRLRFLTSKETLDELNELGEIKLSQEQIDMLTDESNNSWIFISPTKLLLQYLRQNMQEEGLTTNDKNTIMIEDFRRKMFREYGLRNPDKDGPFKIYKQERYSVLIFKPKEVVKEFEKYIVHSICSNLQDIYKLETSSFSWHNKAVIIKSYLKRAASIKNLGDLSNLFYSLADNEKAEVEEIENNLKDKLERASVSIKNNIKNQPQTIEKINTLFEQWRKEKISTEEDDDFEENEETTTYISFDIELYRKLKPLIRNHALTLIDKTAKLSKRQSELYILIEEFIQQTQQLREIGELALFTRKFSFLCRGIERNIFSQIAKLYKNFRKEIDISKRTDLYKTQLLNELIKKDNNKYLHPDEQNLLLGFINNMLLSIYKKSRTRFSSLRHSYIDAYKRCSKPILVIDEATDYTQLDYYMICSFQHYDVSSVTLSGDIMQGLNEYGIKSWDELKWIMPNLNKYELNISYRQTPTLLHIAKEMYKDDQGFYPNYKSYMQSSDYEPSPSAFVSEEEDEKVEWISNRIKEVIKAYSEMPSIAIFVSEDENIGKLIERFNNLDILNGVCEVADCSGNRLLEGKDYVRIFRLSEVKGMEFEVSFFYDIDKAVEIENSEEIMRRYLYVGVSRATTHLAATFTKQEGNENILKYFSQENNW